MPEDTTPSEEPSRPAGRGRLLMGTAGVGAALLLLAFIASLRSDDPVPAATSPAPTSTRTAPFTAEDFTSAFSPFAAPDFVSRDAPLPPNPEIADAAAVYVDAVRGDDSGDGSIANPVAGLEAAQTIARRLLVDATADVVVYLRGGVHPRTAPFELLPEDSGRNGGDMVYRSFPGERAVIDGGVRLESWETAFDDVVVAPVPDSVGDVRQFFAGGQRQPRAATAEAEGEAIAFVKGQYLGSSRNVAMTVDSQLVDRYAHPEDLELLYVGVAISGHGITRANGSEIRRPSWKSHRLPVTAATDLGDGVTRLDIGNGALHHASERGYDPIKLLPSDRFFLENALELLDSPGEWYFDPRERLLYWWPPDAPARADAWVPATDMLLHINGSPDALVRNVRIEGISFRHAGYTLPNEAGYAVSQGASWFAGWKSPEWMEYDGAVHSSLQLQRPTGPPGAAIEVDSARDITLSQNAFAHLGAVGVMLHNDVGRATIDGNLFADVSAAALVAGHPAHDVIDEPMEGPIADLSFTNNVVDAAAAEFFGSVGVQVTKARGAVVSHNVFRNLPYSAVSSGWGWDNNPASAEHLAIRIENNYFEDIVNRVYDGSPIYILGPVAVPGAPRAEHTHIRGNFANNGRAGPQFKAPNDTVDPDFAKRPGIQLDAGVRNIVIEDNVLAGATVWFQLTEWSFRRGEPDWVEGLSLTGSGNWSDTTAALPPDTSLVGVEPAARFEPAAVPPAVRRIIEGAGLEPGITPPPLP